VTWEPRALYGPVLRDQSLRLRPDLDERPLQDLACRAHVVQIVPKRASYLGLLRRMIHIVSDNIPPPMMHTW
jgi:hypothetical protein